MDSAEVPPLVLEVEKELKNAEIRGIWFRIGQPSTANQCLSKLQATFRNPLGSGNSELES